jgi:eukaryotic-like serine/threonine-protein kinase
VNSKEPAAHSNHPSSEQLSALFAKAVSLSQAEQARFLNQVSEYDLALSEDLASLLSHHDAENCNDFLAAPLVDQQSAIRLLTESQALQPGDQLGSYQIVGLLGVGGMGEVYLANDLSLHRKVAIKLLPKLIAGDILFLDRLEQEARAASRLNHPNILTVYQFVREPEHCYLVTEWVDGGSLRSRIQQSLLSLSEALFILRQVAAALVTAHKHGIIHRDIKPENLMLRSEGLAKVLDFGLAKVTPLPAVRPFAEIEAAASSEDPSGFLLGTANYMSPEQVRGELLDERTDIWSWGVVLYEALTGVRPFERATPSLTLKAVLGANPDFKVVPRRIKPLLHRCLSKRRNRRFRSFEALLRELDQLHPAPAQLIPLPADHRSLPKVRPGLSLFLLSTIVTILSIWAWDIGRNRPFEVERLERLTSLGNVTESAISPDGRFIAYASGDARRQELHVRQLALETDVLRVPSAEGVILGITFAPKREHFYFVRKYRGVGRLFRVPCLTGSPELVLDGVDSPVTFSPGGSAMCFVRNDAANGLCSLVSRDTRTGVERLLLTRRPPVYLSSTPPVWSPDGKSLVFSEYRSGGQGVQNQLHRLGLIDGRLARIEHPSWFLINRPGWLNNSLELAVAAMPTGAIESSIYFLHPFSNRLYPLRTSYGDYGNLSLTTDSNLLATVQTEHFSDIWIAPSARPTDARRVNVKGTRFRGLSWSGNDHLVSQSSIYGRPDLWEIDSSGGDIQAITGDDSYKWDMVVARDRHFVVFVSDRDGASHLWRSDLTPAASHLTNPRRVTHSLNIEQDPALTPDGKWLIFTSISRDKKVSTLWKVASTGGKPEQLTDSIARRPVVSPNGKWIACEYSPNRQTWYMSLLPVSGAIKPRPLRTISTDSWMRWSPDGKYLAYTDKDDGSSNIWAQPLTGQPARQLTRFRDHVILAFDWAPNGRYIAYIRGRSTSDLILMHRRPHWTASLLHPKRPLEYGMGLVLSEQRRRIHAQDSARRDQASQRSSHYQ